LNASVLSDAEALGIEAIVWRRFGLPRRQLEGWSLSTKVAGSNGRVVVNWRGSVEGGKDCQMVSGGMGGRKIKEGHDESRVLHCAHLLSIHPSIPLLSEPAHIPLERGGAWYGQNLLAGCGLTW
jgi:hypothetical protein